MLNHLIVYLKLIQCCTSGIILKNLKKKVQVRGRTGKDCGRKGYTDTLKEVYLFMNG